LDKIDAGLHVEILLEGQPVGGISKPEKALQTKLVKAMADQSDDHFYVMTSKARASNRRYRYDHAKYVVVDGKSLLIGSENFSENSHPTGGKPGNRGWEAYFQDTTLAKQFQKIYETDADTSQGDVMDLVDDSAPAAFSWGLAVPALPRPRGSLPENQSFDADSVTSIFSPNSLDGLTSLLDNAKKTLQLELMTFSPEWGKTGDDSPLLLAVEAAAKRGVSVQVLLNDETVFEHGPPGMGTRASTNNNHTTVDLLNQFAEDEGVDLEARIADVSAMKVSYIHNKGALIDGEKVLVSSINWNQNSVENNREAGVVITSSDVYDFFDPVFKSDWDLSAN
jgi:phosphatidylserine/phosphatidylglycerophosphate/cardiolipin synthase-like enzyme